jgi:Ca2+-binding EF-hand superfamily protein
MKEIDVEEALSNFQPQTEKVILQFQEFVESQFAQLDLDHDGFLSREELWTALYDGNRSTRELAFLSFLLERIHEIALCYQDEGGDKPDCISRRDLQEYFATIFKDLGQNSEATGQAQL